MKICYTVEIDVELNDDDLSESEIDSEMEGVSIELQKGVDMVLGPGLNLNACRVVSNSVTLKEA